MGLRLKTFTLLLTMYDESELVIVQRMPNESDPRRVVPEVGQEKFLRRQKINPSNPAKKFDGIIFLEPSLDLRIILSVFSRSRNNVGRL